MCDRLIDELSELKSRLVLKSCAVDKELAEIIVDGRMLAFNIKLFNKSLRGSFRG
jgi:hypothetical protein